MDKISLIIPSRCEKYLQPTIDTAIENSRGAIEIISVIDGQFEKGRDGYDPKKYLPLKMHPLVRPIYLDESIGQRAAYNMGVKYSTGNYIMKIDGHCILCPEWDIKLIEQIKDQNFCTTIIPEMRRLDVEKWEPKERGISHFMFFGTDLFCHYWREYKKRPEAKGDLVPVMTGQGSCWFMRREWNDYIGILDENCGSWGKVGIEISLKTWLCGGQQLVSKKVWQAHYFRVHEGGFPYSLSGRKIRKAKEYAQNQWYFKDNAFSKQVHPFSWLLKKFEPVPGWEIYHNDEYKINRAIIYITDNTLENSLANAARKCLEKAIGFVPIISISDQPLDFGKNIIFKNKNGRNYLNLYEKILEGLKHTDAEYIYICEHDIFYHSSHFVFVPSDNKIYHNLNCYYWKIGLNNYLPCGERKALSQAIAKKEIIKKHCEQRLIDLNRNINAKLDYEVEYFESEKPNIDVRHDNNFSGDGKRKKEYYNQQSKEIVTNIAFWGSVQHMMKKAHYKGYTRTDIINYLIEQNCYKSYLEIGVKDGRNYKQINCNNKMGVDPNPKNFEDRFLLKMTSDEFFNSCNGNRFDIIFIDGLHEAPQAIKDFDNSLKILNDGGVIVMHDCNPANEKEQMVPPKRFTKIWTGDVWKAFARLRTRPELDCYVINTNNGVGIVRKGIQKPLLNIPQMEELNYNFLNENRKKILNLKTIEEFKKREVKQ